MAYDANNVFARILRGEIPCRRRSMRTTYVLAFHDINPQAPVHILVIPKGAYVSLDDFSARRARGRDRRVSSARWARSRATRASTGDGYRILANHGVDAHQEVPHFHVHILRRPAARPNDIKGLDLPRQRIG